VVNIIVAYDKNRAIGKDGQLLWHLTEDMAHFKEVTGTSPVIMGRKTWDSLPARFKPLPRRLNIVVSRTKHDAVFYSPSEPYWVTSLKSALRLVDNMQSGSDVFIIGGGEIYREALNEGVVDRVIASEVRGNYEGDTFFPELLGWKGEVKKEFKDFVVVEYLKWTN
jgi:dihydrofolate reductase